MREAAGVHRSIHEFSTGCRHPSGCGNWGTGDAARNAAPPSQFVSFAISDDQYGIDIMSVREIRGWSEITRLPRQPDYVRGALNLRVSSFQSLT